MRSRKSYGHRVSRSTWVGCFHLCWTTDRWVTGSRLRIPTSHTRDADEAGARRFAKRWGVAFPEEPPPGS